MITPVQSRMARAALGWSVRDLGKSAHIAGATVNRFEMGRAAPIPATLNAMQHAFESAGILFIEHGVVYPQPAKTDAPESANVPG
jgi:transcriptional regulator with XRE-family HTH domain